VVGSKVLNVCHGSQDAITAAAFRYPSLLVTATTLPFLIVTPTTEQPR
jgi:hypothetical protein